MSDKDYAKMCKKILKAQGKYVKKKK
jgi:hypothetical protein